MRKKILITGSGGQLGSCFKKIAPQYELDYDFIFADFQSLDIIDDGQILAFFEEHQPEICINAAAYTAVDLAEKERDKAFAVNADGTENLAKICAEQNVLFIHISTDYVFDGETNLDYCEDDFTNPLGVYGESKRAGEERAIEANPKTVIIRTSWLYSEFGKNFVKTMLNLFSQKEELGIVADQFGQPTNANDLAEAVMKIIEFPQKKYGIFHYSNYPETTWYHFAEKIAELSQSNITLNPLTTSEYPTLAKRPFRSTFCLDKIENIYQIDLKHWENSLEDCIKILNA